MAIAEGDLNEVKNIIAVAPRPVYAGAKIILVKPLDPSRDRLLTTPLIWAVKERQLDIATYFLNSPELHPNPNDVDSEGRRVLLVAAMNAANDPSWLQFLLMLLSKRDVDTNVVDSDNNGFLHILLDVDSFIRLTRISEISEKQWEAIIRIMTTRPTFQWNKQNLEGETFLHVAVRRSLGYLGQIVRVLVTNNAPVDFNQKDNAGNTFLAHAFTYFNDWPIMVDLLSLVDLLSSANYDWNSKNNRGDGILHDVHDEAALCILTRAAEGKLDINVNMKNNHGQSFLHKTRYIYDPVPLIPLLDELNFDWHAIDNQGNNLLFTRNRRYLRALLERGVNVNHQSIHGETAGINVVRSFSYRNNLECLELLDEFHHDWSIRDHEGKTALDHARQALAEDRMYLARSDIGKLMKIVSWMERSRTRLNNVKVKDPSHFNFKDQIKYFVQSYRL